MGAERERHPKGYLQWLCHDSMSDHGTTYRETDGGRKALQGLHWPALAIHRGLNFLNALVEDVANALGESPPVFPGVAPVATSRAHRPPDHVLRNL